MSDQDATDDAADETPEEFPEGAYPFFVAFRTKDGEIGVQLDIEALEAPEHAGVLLADFARHFAMAFAQSGKASSPDAALDEMLDLMEDELENPTDTPRGGISN
jgi:hypothetical protein